MDKSFNRSTMISVLESENSTNIALFLCQSFGVDPLSYLTKSIETMPWEIYTLEKFEYIFQLDQAENDLFGEQKSKKRLIYLSQTTFPKAENWSQLKNILDNSPEQTYLSFPQIKLTSLQKQTLSKLEINLENVPTTSKAVFKNLLKKYVETYHTKHKTLLTSRTLETLSEGRDISSSFDRVDFMVLAEISDWQEYLESVKRKTVNFFELNLDLKKPENFVKNLYQNGLSESENQLLLTILANKLKKTGDSWQLKNLILTDYHSKTILRSGSTVWFKKWLYDCLKVKLFL
jgi:hypothetical protein